MYIFFFFLHLCAWCWVVCTRVECGCECMNAHEHIWKNMRKETRRKDKERKRTESGTESETSDPNPGNWCAHQGRRTDGKKKKEQKVRNRERSPNPTTLDYTVTTNDRHVSNSDPVLLLAPSLRPTGVKYIKEQYNKNTYWRLCGIFRTISCRQFLNKR